MSLTMKSAALSPYCEHAVLLHRSTPRQSVLCPRCGRQCSYSYIMSNGPASSEIRCPDCGISRVNAGLEGGKAVFTVEGTGEIYDGESNLKAAKARLDAFDGPPQERCILMAEVAWETYLFLMPNAPPVWKDAVDAFVSCDGFTKDQARRMVPWILRFCGIGGNRELNRADLRACRKAAEILEAPAAADECMLWAELFDLYCREGPVTDDVVGLPDIAKDAYLALPETEKAGCPGFLAMRALMMCDHAFLLWNDGFLDLSEAEFDAYGNRLWEEAVSEAVKMLSAGGAMTPRMFRAFSGLADPMSLSLGDATVRAQLNLIGSKSEEYRDAFEARAEIMEVLVLTTGEPVMPFSCKHGFDWTRESFRKLEGAVRKLERYDDPAVIWNLLTDAYCLMYACVGGSEKMEYCDQLAEEARRRLMDVEPKLRMNKDLASMFGLSEPGKGFAAQNRAKPKGKSKKERIAERRKAHIAKRK